MSGIVNSTGAVSGLIGTTVGSVDLATATFPSGHVIQSKILAKGLAASSPHVSTTSDTFVDTGIAGSFTTVASSANSWLTFEFHCGMTHVSTTSNWGSTTLTLKTSSTTTWATGDDMIGSNNVETDYRNRFQPKTDGYQPQRYRYIYHAGDSQYPTSLSSYTASQTLYARLYICEPAGSNFYLVHTQTYWNFTMQEIMR